MTLGFKLRLTWQNPIYIFLIFPSFEHSIVLHIIICEQYYLDITWRFQTYTIKTNLLICIYFISIYRSYALAKTDALKHLLPTKLRRFEYYLTTNLRFLNYSFNNDFSNIHQKNGNWLTRSNFKRESTSICAALQARQCKNSATANETRSINTHNNKKNNVAPQYI